MNKSFHRESKPNYQCWNEEEFSADLDIQTMTPVQKWMTRTLLQYSWICPVTHPRLPDDDNRLWRMAGCGSREQWDAEKAVVRQWFTPKVIDDIPCLTHAWIERNWFIIESRRNRQSEGGKRGMKARFGQPDSQGEGVSENEEKERKKEKDDLIKSSRRGSQGSYKVLTNSQEGQEIQAAAPTYSSAYPPPCNQKVTGDPLPPDAETAVKDKIDVIATAVYQAFKYAPARFEIRRFFCDFAPVDILMALDEYLVSVKSEDTQKALWRFFNCGTGLPVIRGIIDERRQIIALLGPPTLIADEWKWTFGKRDGEVDECVLCLDRDGYSLSMDFDADLRTFAAVNDDLVQQIKKGMAQGQ